MFFFFPYCLHLSYLKLMLKAAYGSIGLCHELLNATKLGVFFHLAFTFSGLKENLSCCLFYNVFGSCKL